MPRSLPFFLILAGLLPARAEIATQLSSPHLLIDESARFSFTIPSLTWPQLPDPAPLFLKQESSEPVIGSAHGETTFTYQLGGVAPGLHRLPALTLPGGQTAPRLVRLYAQAPTPGHFELKGTRIPYFTTLLTPTPAPYPGQSVPVEAKLYLPAELDLIDPGFPQFTSEKLAASVFEPRQGTSRWLHQGREFTVYSFQSRASLLDNSPGQLHTGHISPLLRTRDFSRGIARWEKIRPTLSFAPLILPATPLPSPQPADFFGAVGHFTLSARSEQNELRVGQSFPITLTLNGDIGDGRLPAPTPTNHQGWKISPPVLNQKASDHTRLVFSQFLTPEEAHDTLPTFTFSYFDPALARYQSARSKPVPIRILPAPDVPEYEAHSDRDAVKGTMTITDFEPLPIWLWLLPLPMIAVLIFAWKKKRLARKSLPPRPATSPLEDLKKLRSFVHEPASDFYRELGQFLEQHPLHDQELHAELLRQRDELHYRPDRPTDSTPDPQASEILARLEADLQKRTET
ncbi:MAG: hypothetical protein ACQKBY_07760 [Verrucomicrobiales bacterium]